MACEFSEGIFRDALFASDLNQLPGNWGIEDQHICNYYDGKPFMVCDNNGIDYKIDNTENEIIAFHYYYDIWENYHEFGLPHGKGSLYECNWLLDFVKYFNRIFNDIEIFRSKRK